MKFNPHFAHIAYNKAVNSFYFHLIYVISDENSETLISFASHEQDYSSSDSEDLFSTQRQFKKVPEVTVKSKSKFKTNKIHDFKTQIENNGKIRAYNGISENRSKRLGTPVRDDRRSSIGSSSMDLDFGKSSTSLSEISYKEKIRDKFNAIKVSLIILLYLQNIILIILFNYLPLIVD